MNTRIPRAWLAVLVVCLAAIGMIGPVGCGAAGGGGGGGGNGPAAPGGLLGECLAGGACNEGLTCDEATNVCGLAAGGGGEGEGEGEDPGRDLPAAGTVLRESTFDTDDEGWLLTGDGFNTTPSWEYDSGEGHVSHHFNVDRDELGDPAIGRFSAPLEWLGDLRDAFGGELLFDLQAERLTDAAAPLVVITGADGDSISVGEGMEPGTAWQHYSFVLSADSDWMFDGGLATDEEICAVLVNVTGIEIRGEFAGGRSKRHAIGHLDNVRITAGAGGCAPPDSDSDPLIDPRVLAESTFEAGDEDWVIGGDGAAVEPTWDPEAGRPDGHLTHQFNVDRDELGDREIGRFWAPDKFLGDLASAFGGALSFDLRAGRVTDAAAPLVVIEAADGTSISVGEDMEPGTGWEHYEFTLSTESAWMIDGGLATDEEIVKVLSDVVAIGIRGEFADGRSRRGAFGYLDNVRLTAGDGSALPASAPDDDDPEETYENLLFVDASARGANDGSNWQNAYTDLQDALADAADRDREEPLEIWIAAGTYTPGSQRTDSFAMINNVAICGGFDGTEEPETFDLDERNVEANETILNGGGTSYHVFYHPEGTNLDKSAVLDGVTIVGGNAKGKDEASLGGGMCNLGSSPTLRGCTFRSNLGKIGAGMYNQDCAPVLTNCTFTNNLASEVGGGMSNFDASPSLTDCQFSDNFVDGAYTTGGGLSNWASAVSLTNCVFQSNRAGWSGGGMRNYGGSAILSNCSFEENLAEAGGGMANWESDVTLTNCTFLGNSADGSAGMHDHATRSTLANCTFSKNAVTGHGGAIGLLDSSPTLTDCVFTDNSAGGDGGAVWGINDTNPVLVNCLFEQNTGKYGGALRSDGGKPFLAYCTFRKNTAEAGGGLSGGDSVLVNCVFDGNSADSDGGGMSASYSTLTNCIFTGNSAVESGGAVKGIFSLDLVNCTFNRNSAARGGAVFGSYMSEFFLSNCILWDNGNEIHADVIGDRAATATVTYSCIAGGYDGIGNIDGNPRFVDAAGGDLRLQSGSPCIDAGDNAAVMADAADLDADGNLGELTPYDLDGQPRMIGTVDMGAYEQ